MTQDKALKILQSGKNVFLTGEPGAGKTHTVNRFTDWMRGEGQQYAVTASTGIAATHIKGSTIHSWSGLGIKEKATPDLINKLKYSPYIAKKLLNTKTLIIDEVSMLHPAIIDAVDDIIRGVRDTPYIPFGGMQVIFVGDFFQLPPVSSGALTSFAFESKAWKDLNLVVCYLTEQHRQNDKDFLDILTTMRNGKVTDDQKQMLLDKKGKKKPKTVLFTKNAQVDRMNEEELGKIKGDSKKFEMTSQGNEFLVEKLKKSCLSPETLELKVGAIVMFTRNNFEERYVNGTLGEVIKFNNAGMPVVKTKDGQMIIAKHAEWSIEDTDASIFQLPLKLAWALTIHKSQGMSLDEAYIDLSDTFEFGQGYVAISRVRSLAGLYLEGANDKAFKMHPKVVFEDREFRKKSELVDSKF